MSVSHALLFYHFLPSFLRTFYQYSDFTRKPLSFSTCRDRPAPPLTRISKAKKRRDGHEDADWDVARVDGGARGAPSCARGVYVACEYTNAFFFFITSLYTPTALICSLSTNAETPMFARKRHGKPHTKPGPGGRITWRSKAGFAGPPPSPRK